MGGQQTLDLEALEMALSESVSENYQNKVFRIVNVLNIAMQHPFGHYCHEELFVVLLKIPQHKQYQVQMIAWRTKTPTVENPNH